MISWVLLAIACLGYPVLWKLRARHWTKVFEAGTRLLTEEVTTLKIEVERSREVATEERAKRERYFGSISKAESECLRWKDLYHSQSIGHGNAQELMMRTITNAQQALAAKGVKFSIPSVLYAIREEFQAQHEMPSRAAAQEPKAPDPAPPAA